jgi:hypothetical protein
MYQTGGTIKSTLEAIERHEYVLPAIQREFVWWPEQICQLFDSMMQGYPFGAFLYWKIQPANSSQFRFYDFVRDYHERDSPHCPALPVQHDKAITAVLDGQQRLTALNIALRGSMAWRQPYKRWTSPDAFPKRYLYLDLLGTVNEDDPGQEYRFDFLTAEKAEQDTQTACWFKVRDILGMQSGPAMLKWLNERLAQEDLDRAYAVLDRLFQVVHHKTQIAYFEETSQDLDKVVNIFIRTNSGGTVLSYSDLLLSVAVAQWSTLDAREEIHALVDEINGIGEGFAFSQDLVLKAGLMLSEIGNVGFKVSNFNRENMEKLEERWTGIRDAIHLSVHLLDRFGFCSQTLRADSAILPIAYYLYLRKPGSGYLTHTKHRRDRDALREWLIRSLLKSGIWGSGLDTLLTELRKVIAKHGQDGFPAEKLKAAMARRGKSLSFTAEEVEGLVIMRYSDKRLFPLLALLFPAVDLTNNYHVDHVFPKSRFTNSQLAKAGVPEDDREWYQEACNELPNLQLLEGALNNEKRKCMPAAWLEKSLPDMDARTEYRRVHRLGTVPAELQDFPDFYEARRANLYQALCKLLGAKD